MSYKYISLDWSTSRTGICVIDHNDKIEFLSDFHYTEVVSPALKRQVGLYKNGKPKFKTIKPEKIKKHVDFIKWNDFISRNSDAVWIVEKQVNRMNQVSKGGNTMMLNYGGLLALLRVNKVEFHEILPAIWKRKMGILGSKLTVKERKQLSMDKAEQYGIEAPDHDNAEAFLMLKYWKTEKSETGDFHED